MKKLLTLLIFIPLVSFGQKTLKEKPEINLVKAEAACGICMLNMQGEECELAVKIKDSKYYVIGTGIDDHGNAHSKKGFCNAIRKAEIQGKVINNKYHITYFELVK
ncbi:MAG: hypothetical protein HON66_03775 [Formosa sp.]|jgi:hypothetical protein|nr:hypothetical protein [Formosa sp.]MDB2426354.1 DUF6370 family protein [Flavobacteriaceae bacterium]MDC0463419.1 DUF6370 family protein [Flavobacteriaceae bacterium]|tara:strand:+ start:583 stop:900 length:318 start_codon:yes stop_codon:yes gene_type:complete